MPNTRNLHATKISRHLCWIRSELRYARFCKAEEALAPRRQNPHFCSVGSLMDGGGPVSAWTYNAKPLVVGLVNNMWGAAAEDVHAQFASALIETQRHIILQNLPLPDARSAADFSISRDKFQNSEIDAVIVTGLSPAFADIRDEPIWPRLTALHDWCETNSIPTLWSCFSAHAAVLHHSGVKRQKLPLKISGIFPCVSEITYHPLFRAMPARWTCPHSRHNGLPATLLAENGYTVLSQAGAAGVDIFTRADGTPFFFFQGHPEYRPDTLMREYTRDIRRFVCGETNIKPVVPSGYLDFDDEELSDALAALRRRDSIAATLNTIRAEWREPRCQLLTNWVDIAASHVRRKQYSPIPAEQISQDPVYVERSSREF